MQVYSINNTYVINIILSLMIINIIGCIPSYTTDKLPIEGMVLPLRDELNNDNINKSLIIPLYVTSKGLSSGSGHGPGSTKDQSFFAHPFFYNSEERFKPNYIKSIGLISPIGMVYLGKSTGIYGLLVIAKGYYPKMIFNIRYIDKEDNDYILKPVETKDADIPKEAIRNILSSGLLDDPKVMDFLSFPNNSFAPIEIRLTEEEIKVIKDYVGIEETEGGKGDIHDKESQGENGVRPKAPIKTGGN